MQVQGIFYEKHFFFDSDIAADSLLLRFGDEYVIALSLQVLMQLKHENTFRLINFH